MEFELEYIYTIPDITRTRIASYNCMHIKKMEDRMLDIVFNYFKNKDGQVIGLQIVGKSASSPFKLGDVIYAIDDCPLCYGENEMGQIIKTFYYKSRIDLFFLRLLK